MYYIHELNTNWTIILIQRNTGVMYFKPVQIIGWWTDTKYFINRKICILKFITDIQNTGIESMYIRDSNVDYEGVIILHRTVGHIKTDNLNMKNHI